MSDLLYCAVQKKGNDKGFVEPTLLMFCLLIVLNSTRIYLETGLGGSVGDSFFDKQRVITSTPNANIECAGSSAQSFNNNTVIESLKTISLFGVDDALPNEESIEQSAVNDTVIRVETNKPEECKVMKTPLNTATNPFRFHGGNKCKQGDSEPKRVRKIEKKPPSCAEEITEFETSETLKLKEMEVQEKRQLELVAKQKQEETEIALLRKKMVHKAQSIQKYKLGLPKLQKRPLTDPQTPLTLKRHRTDSNSSN